MNEYRLITDAQSTFLYGSHVSFRGLELLRLESGDIVLFNGEILWMGNAAGERIGAPVSLSDLLDGERPSTSNTVQAAALSDGGFVLGLQHSSDTVGAAPVGRMQVFDPDGTPRGAAFETPAPALDIEALAGGLFAVTYVEFPASGHPRLMMRGYSAEGVALGTPTLITNDARYAEDLGPVIEQMDNGQIVVAWRHMDDGRVFRIFNADGTAATPEINVFDYEFGGSNEVSESFEQAVIVERPSGGFAIFWGDSASNVQGRLFTAEGAAEGAVFTAAAGIGHSSTFDVSVTDDGYFLLATGSRSNAPQVALHVLNPEGVGVLRNARLASDGQSVMVEGFAATGDGSVLFLRGTTSAAFTSVEFENFTVLGEDNDVLRMPETLHFLDASGGNDIITGTSGDDYVEGGDGNDILIFLPGGNNRGFGGDGYDQIQGGDGHDALYGGETAADLADAIYGRGGNDTIDGGYGNDELRGDAGDDVIEGGHGADTIVGGTGNDRLSGGAFGDAIFAGAGADFVNGGFGHDRVNGGAGADTFYHVGVLGHGSDWIQDFSDAEGDRLQLGGSGQPSDFRVNFAETENAGAAGVEEAFIIFQPTGQILWALVDGAAQASIDIVIRGQTYDLLA